MKWILILMFAVDGGNDGQGGGLSAEFNSKSSCLTAISEIENNVNKNKRWGFIHNDDIVMLCVPKGD